MVAIPKDARGRAVWNMRAVEHRDLARNDAPRRLYRPSTAGPKVRLPALVKHRPASVVLWSDDQRMLVVTGLRRRSSNGKTGAMLQAWILPVGVNPSTAVRTGEDEVVCGTCPHRPVLHRETGAGRCYVKVDKAPASVWKAVARHNLRAMPQDVALALVAEAAAGGALLRWGAWGDPGYLPLDLVERVSALFRGRTGYTHRWRERPDLRPFVMASVDSETEAREAWAQGWRTFRVMVKGDGRMARTVLCPASKEAGYRTTCADCRLCGGSDVAARSVEIFKH